MFVQKCEHYVFKYWYIDWAFYNSIDSSVVTEPLNFEIWTDCYYRLDLSDTTFINGRFNATIYSQNVDEAGIREKYEPTVHVKLWHDSILVFNKIFTWEEMDFKQGKFKMHWNTDTSDVESLSKKIFYIGE